MSVPAPAADRVSDRLPITHAALRQQIVLLPLYIAGLFVAYQALALFGTPGARDAVGLVKGHDFVHFYTLGTLARTGNYARLYDQSQLTADMWRIVPESRPASFIPAYGPVFAAAFIPLSRLPYVTAVHAWLALSTLAYLASVALMVRLVSGIRQKPVMWLLAMLNPAFWLTIITGQTSALTLCLIVAAWWLLERRHALVAGLVLGVLLLKPPLGLGLCLVFVLAREWRVAGGMLALAGLQVTAGVALAGTAGTIAHVEAVSGLVCQGGLPVSLPQDLHSAAGFFRLLFGPTPLAAAAYVVAAAAVLFTAARSWRTDAPLRRRYSLTILAMLLAAPHLYLYDLLLLTPVLAVSWEAGVAEDDRRLTMLAWLGWFAPLTSVLALATRVQPSVLVLAALLIVLGSGCRRRRQASGAVRPEAVSSA